MAKAKFDAFDEGLDGDSIAGNFTNCGYNFLQNRYFEAPTFAMKKLYASGNENVMNTTIYMRNVSIPLTQCTEVAQEFYLYYTAELGYYGGLSGARQAMLFNLFANSVRI